ncbi:MAG: acyltransferase [Marmoricola sp.]|nr:acyltransferase [Marmoricola sp.]
MRRLTGLDGLRGIAALIVVIYHTSLVAEPYLNTHRVGDAWWWISASPLKFLTAGPEFVLVFFILSGLVVALPALREGFGWTKYYAARLIRLYVPVWAALAVSALLVLSLPRNSSMVAKGSWMATSNATSATSSTLFSQAGLTRASYNLDNVMWSLRWEIVFSIALPLFILLAARIGRFWVPAIGVAASLYTVGTFANNAQLTYLPLFLAGTLAAVHIEEITTWARKRSGRFWTLTASASALLIVLGPIVGRLPGAGALATFATGAAAFGAVGLVLSVIGSPTLDSALSARVPQFFGKISFSLYLVHVPLLTVVTYLVGDSAWILIAALVPPLAVATGWGFYLAVERPSQKAAKSIGAAAGRAVRIRRPAREWHSLVVASPIRHW